MDILFVVPKMG